MNEISKEREALSLLKDFENSVERALEGKGVTKSDLIRLREKFGRLNENLDKQYKKDLAYDLEVMDNCIMRLKPEGFLESPDPLLEIDERLEDIFNYFNYDRREEEF